MICIPIGCLLRETTVGRSFLEAASGIYFEGFLNFFLFLHSLYKKKYFTELTLFFLQKDPFLATKSK